MSIIRLIGGPALLVAMATNRQCEILKGGNWTTANSQVAARRTLQADPGMVRLCGDDRVLLEDVLHAAIPVNTNLPDYMATLNRTLTQAEQDAVTLILGATS